MHRIMSVFIVSLCAQGAWGEEADEVASDDQATQEERVEGREADEPVVIGHLESRGYKITILAVDDRRLFTLHDRDGNLVAEQLSETDLRARHPEIHEKLKEGIAGEPIMMLFKDQASTPYADIE